MAPTIDDSEATLEGSTGEAHRTRSFRLTGAEWAVFSAVLVFAAVTRLYGVVDYPIYFFCDEAHQINLARDLVENGLRDHDGAFAPIYFRNVRVFNLGLSVWIHAAPVAIFGKSIFVARATSVVIGLLGTAALMMALKWFFGTRMWWAGGLVMATLPAWFLHSRTAFETVMMVGFYSVFVLAYLLYREVSARWLPAVIVSGAATFYSYSNGQGVMFVSCLLLLATDWRYHWRVLTRHRRVTAAALVVTVLVAAPYLRFRYVLHPEMMELHLDDLNSYWVEDISTREKIGHFVSIYLRGLGPEYWFTEDLHELDRHRMLGYPHLPVWLAPTILIGLGVSLWRSWRSPAHRLVLIAALAAPFSAALVGLRITRVLAMMVPATLAATIGIDQIRRWLAAVVRERVLAAVAGLTLAASAATMTADALINGPLWFSDYGMHGLQWGAKELFADVRHRLAAAPDGQKIVISHLWANNADAYDVFFLTAGERASVEWGDIDSVLRERRGDVGPSTAFILTPEEFERALTSPKLDIHKGFSTIADPSGKPGFYVVRLSYTEAADAVFAAERAERRKLVNSLVTIGGLDIPLSHPKLDHGEIQFAFDGDLKTLARTLDANPARLTLAFPEERSLAGVRFHLWTEHYLIKVTAVRADGEVVELTRGALTGLPPEPVELRFTRAVEGVVRLELEIRKEGDEHMHLREIELLE